SRKKTRESNDSPGSPLNKNEVLKPQAFEKLAGIKTSTKFRAPQIIPAGLKNSLLEEGSKTIQPLFPQLRFQNQPDRG
ncbi:hypothetical protein, partial [Allobaculum mucilyticum]|uniref:hypothetical protein n=1 Tax=Allobaculum mucilyticum TaxID=2834459 RepID=UPI001E29EC3E